MEKISIIFILCIAMFLKDLKALDVPVAQIENIQSTKTSISFDYKLKDISDDVILNNEHYFPAVSIYDGDTLIDYDIAVETEEYINVEFDALQESKEYQISVNAPYDLLGNGEPYNEKPYTLIKDNIKTNSMAPEGYIEIRTCKDLESIGKGSNYPGASHLDAWELDSNYALVSDIDCSASNPNNSNYDISYQEDGFDSIGIWIDTNENGLEEWTEIDGFSGLFDGQGYEINGVYINRDEGRCIGVFKIFETSSIIKSVGITDAEIVGENYVGGLVGRNNAASINDSYFNGEINASEEVGGLIGYNWNGVINNCYVNANIFGNLNVGGLVGYNWESNITNSYFSGNVYGNEDVGGLVGDVDNGVVENSFSNGSSSGASLIGETYSKAEIRNSFSTSTNKNGLIGEVVTYNGYTPIISDSYQYDQSSCTGNCTGYPTVSNEELNDITWYQEVLGFDENYNLFKVENGYYPYVMKVDLSNEVRDQEDTMLP